MFPSHGPVAMPRFQPYQRYMFQFIPIQLLKGNEIVLPCDRHSIETATLSKHVTKYKNMRKLRVEFLMKFENGAIKSGRDNSILITKSINLPLFTLILYGVGGPM